MKRFGVMLDCSRNAVMKPEQVKNFATILKKFGYNMLQLYTEDTYEVENEPYFGYMRGRYTMEELKGIVEHCNDIGMEVIPCIQTLAHLNQIFLWNVYKEINDTANILLVGDERTYILIENMFKTLRKTFTSEYLHIGMDEAHMLGLGKYLDIHGYQNRFDIIYRHLLKVRDIAEKYGFKPIMWSDMFFRLTNNGNYYSPEPKFSADVVSKIPENVGLVYWDYYHDEEEYYTKMMEAHKQAGETWFAGGARTWSGFAPGNKRTMDTMIPAMCAAKKASIDNIFLTMWGDDGKECSFYSVLPSLFAVRKYYEGETDMDKIKEEFKQITGENYDAFVALDAPNVVGGGYGVSENPCKHMLYNDPFNGFFDSTAKENVSQEYVEYAKQLANYAKDSQYAYLFESMSALCEVLSLKYDLGIRTRIAYQEKNKAELSLLASDYEKTEVLLEKFHKAFQNLWFTENKPHGFDVQDLRFGGLMQRLKSCRLRLLDYVSGVIDCIPELDEELLDYYGNGECYNKKKTPIEVWWKYTASVNVL